MMQLSWIKVLSCSPCNIIQFLSFPYVCLLQLPQDLCLSPWSTCSTSTVTSHTLVNNLLAMTLNTAKVLTWALHLWTLPSWHSHQLLDHTCPPRIKPQAHLAPLSRMFVNNHIHGWEAGWFLWFCLMVIYLHFLSISCWLLPIFQGFHFHWEVYGPPGALPRLTLHHFSLWLSLKDFGGLYSFECHMWMRMIALDVVMYILQEQLDSNAFNKPSSRVSGLGIELRISRFGDEACSHSYCCQNLSWNRNDSWFNHAWVPLPFSILCFNLFSIHFVTGLVHFLNWVNFLQIHM